MFVDELEMYVSGGRGGDGIVSFRREKYVAKGGPDGGDGGDGGSVYLVADPGKHSFLDLRYKHTHKAGNGTSGSSKSRHGARGNDIEIPVPLGTMVRDEQGRVLADLVKVGQRVLVAQGGKGGKGNARFATSRRRVPRLAEKGLPGVERKIFLELKLLAQVGLVGFPNAGKSTLLSRVTEAKPKIAAYPFTTLTPNLGVVKVGDEGDFILADLPGLIEGAHEGAGLGHRFLRHVERNLLLLFLIDLDPDAEPEPAEAYKQLKKELSSFREGLDNYPRVIAGSKIDLPGAADRLSGLKEFVDSLGEEDTPVIGISSVTGTGVNDLVNYLFQKVNELAEGKRDVDEEELILVSEKLEKPLEVNKIDGIFIVTGSAVERAAARTDFDNEDALKRFQNYTRRIGLDKMLRKAGISEGDTVSIGDEEFTYYE